MKRYSLSDYMIAQDASIIEDGDILEYFMGSVPYMYPLLYSVGKVTVGQFKRYLYDENRIQIYRLKRKEDHGTVK